MSITQRQRTGRTGRPDARATAALHAHLLDTATRLFIEQGYAATSIDQVAAAAGAGKQTIYRRYGSKEALFAAVIGELTRDMVALAGRSEQQAAGPLAALRQACWSALETVAQPLPLAVFRILIAEGVRFPLLVERVSQTVLTPLDDFLRRLIQAARDDGQLRDDFPLEDTLRALSGMVTGWLLQQRLMGRTSLPTEAERRAFFEGAWVMFLEGAGR